MPELPEVEALADHLRRHATGATIGRIDVSAFSVLKTFDPPVTALYGQTVTGATRWGKYLGLQVGGAAEPATSGPGAAEPATSGPGAAERATSGRGLYLITHLSRAGWLRWSDKLAAAPLKPGKGPIALRVHLGTPGTAPGLKVADGAAPGLKVAGGAAPGFDLTEAGTQKRLAVWIVNDPASVPQIATLGPDALALTADGLAEILAGTTARLKNVITDQRVIAGIGNAYSDEILHVAKLSPFATGKALPDGQVGALYEAMQSVLTDAVERSVGQQAATLKGEKRSGLRVHARTGMPCPVCGDLVREVSFADKSFQYCSTCQTGGKVLADRRLSRLLK